MQRYQYVKTYEDELWERKKFEKILNNSLEEYKNKNIKIVDIKPILLGQRSGYTIVVFERDE